MGLIETYVNEDIGVMSFNYDFQRNKLSEYLVDELLHALDGFGEEGVRAVILRAHPGVKVWSAGHNVAELPSNGRDPLGWKDSLRKLVRDIEAFSAPVIALVEGSVWGGACELAFACDIIVATPQATFAATPAKLGVPYNATGLMTFLNTVPLHIAKEMLFTGKPLPATRLEKIGVINHIVEADQITEFTFGLARDIAHNASLVVTVIKEQLRILAGAHTLSPYDFERIQGLRRIVYDSEDYAEGISAFKAKRRPVYKGR